MKKRTNKQLSVEDLNTIFSKKIKITPNRQTILPFASEASKNFAIQNNIDYSNVKGTGINGTITKKDLTTFLNNKDKILVDTINTINIIATKNSIPDRDIRLLIRMVKKLSL